MSIFGEMDVNSIPTNPNYLPMGTYRVEFTQVASFTKDDSHRIVFTFTVPMGSEYEGVEAKKYFFVYPNLTEEMYRELPTGRKKSLIELRNLLFGSKSKGSLGLPREAANLSMEELLNEINSSYKGIFADIEVWNGGEEAQFVNVGRVRFLSD